MSNSEERIVVKNSDNKYDYELYENGVEIASGTTKVDMKKKSSKILFSYYDNEEELGMEITIDISVKIVGTPIPPRTICNIHLNTLQNDMFIGQKS